MGRAPEHITLLTTLAYKEEREKRREGKERSAKKQWGRNMS
jgi:hypothetical protein